MHNESLNFAQAEEEMKKWRGNNYTTPKIENKKYKTIRIDLLRIYNEIKQKMQSDTVNARAHYTMDVEFGLALYSYFDTQSWFTMRFAEKDDFWRFLSVMVVPDLVMDRWRDGIDNENSQNEHFYSKGVRIWLKAIWWYIHMSWQGSIEDTRLLLMNKNMNTDTIQNLVERSGRNGVYIGVYRKIMLFYSEIPNSELKNIEKRIKDNNRSDTFFRNIMKLNTAKMMLVEPGLYDNGEEGYVKSLFNELGVIV